MKAKTKIAIKFYARLIGGYTAFFVVVTAFGLLLGKLLETAFIIAGYFTTRFAVPKIKHFDTTQKCISVSTLTFLFAIALLCIPNELSLVWATLAGAVIPLIMYAESLIFDKPQTPPMTVVYVKPQFSTDTCTEEELIERCKELKFSEENTKLAIEFFIKKTKQSIIADELCINEKSVQMRKQRLKQKLNYSFPK